MDTVYIHTNNKQLFGALVSKYSFERIYSIDAPFNVEIINVDELKTFQNIFGKEIFMNGHEVIYHGDDLQSFTLARFMAPQLSGYNGRSVVIDPDVFCCSAKFDEIFQMTYSKPIAAVFSKGSPLSSVMVLDNPRLTHWNVENILADLVSKSRDYRYYMNLDFEKGNVDILPDVFNCLDRLGDDTVLLHNTNRLTQPWKTGLKVDFRINKMKPVLGVVPREFIHTLLGKHKNVYQDHPDKNQVEFFLYLVRGAVQDGAISVDFIADQIRVGYIRKDLFTLLDI